MKTVLHVEDDENDVLLLQIAFRKAGINVRIPNARDGQQAIEYFAGRGRFEDRGRHPLPDLVLRDLKMPVLDGFEVLAWLRKQEKLRELPVYVLSSSGHEMDRRSAQKLGANGYFVKSAEFKDVVSAAAKHLDRAAETELKPEN